MQIGDIAEGTIQSIKPYGAFVDLGKGMSGLLHISQISFDRITNVGSILSEGDKIKVCQNCLVCAALSWLQCMSGQPLTHAVLG